MARRKQKIALELRRDKSKNGRRWLLKYGRFNKDGEIGWAKKEWKIGPTSQLPKPIFFTLQSIVFRHLKKVEGDKNYETMKPKIIVALSEAAIECGCKFEHNPKGRFDWLLGSKRLLAFTVLPLEKHGDAKLSVLAEQLRKHRKGFRRMEQKSGARLRAAIVVLKGGLWKFVPARTRED